MMANFPSGTGISSQVHNTVMLSTIAQLASYPYVDYVPFSGTDFSSGENLGFPLPVLGCNLACQQTFSCIGYVTTIYEFCYLRSINTDPITSIGATSHYQVMPRRQYTIYNSIDYIQAFIIFFNGNCNECRQACDALPGCIGYVNFILLTLYED